MHDPLAVRIVDRMSQGQEPAGGAFRRLGIAGKTMPQVSSIDVFQGEIRTRSPQIVRPPLPKFEDLYNIGMLEPSDRLGLGAESGSILLAGEFPPRSILRATTRWSSEWRAW